MKKFIVFYAVMASLAMLAMGCGGGSSSGGGTTASPNVAFVTSVTGNGNLSTWANAGGQTGLAAGDAICQARANAAGLHGTFKAWLSTSTTDAYCHIQGYDNAQLPNCGLTSPPTAAGPWVRTDGYAFAETIDKLVTGQIFVPIKYDEYGNLLSETRFLSNTSAAGGLLTATGQCNNWTYDNSDTLNTYTVQYGWTEGTTNFWTSYGGDYCDTTTMHLLCMQTGSGPALPARTIPAGAKSVFITSLAHDGNLGGISGADAICRQHAQDAGLANYGNYKAWLSDGSTNAIDHVTATATGPWYRLDGVKIADNKTALATAPLFSTISVTETGTYLGQQTVWTGTDDSGINTGNNCSNWNSNNAAVSGTYGFSSLDTWQWTYSYYHACNLTKRLYCFEDD